MGRPIGTHNEGFEERRQALARAAMTALIAQGGQLSLRQLAEATEVSIPTLKHYFGDREGALAEGLRTMLKTAEPHTRGLADPGALPLAPSLAEVARGLLLAWAQFGVGRVFAAGMVAGLFDTRTGPAYLEGVLEPTVLAIEDRLRVHARRGELDVAADDDFAIRAAALGYLSPLLVALLHQHELSGRTCRALDLSAFAAAHTARFVRAYGETPRESRPVRTRERKRRTRKKT